MPKKRIIASLIVKGGIVVQSIRFKTYLPVGKPEIAARFLDQWGIDEIALLDIDASSAGRTIDPELVRRVSRCCYIPITAGGGVRTVDDMRALLRAGADKIAVNRVASEDLGLIREASRVFGAQCIIGSIDARRGADGAYRTFTDSGRRDVGRHPADYAAALEDAGVGEILLNSIDRDGTREGYDLDLIRQVSARVGVPVIACGGAGRPQDLRQVLAFDEVSAAAAANFFHFTEHSVAIVKSQLVNAGFDVRLDSQADYRAHPTDADGRLRKLPDPELLDQYFEFIKEEVI